MGQNEKWYWQELRLCSQIINSLYSKTLNVSLWRTWSKILMYVFNATNILSSNYTLIFMSNCGQTQTSILENRMWSKKGKNECHNHSGISLPQKTPWEFLPPGLCPHSSSPAMFSFPLVQSHFWKALPLASAIFPSLSQINSDTHLALTSGSWSDFCKLSLEILRPNMF